MINESKANELFQLINDLQDTNKKNIEYYIETGRILNEIKEKKLYMHYASHIKDWIGLLKELNISYTDAKNLINTFLLSNILTEETIELLYKVPLQRIKQLSQLQLTEDNLDNMLLNASCLPQKDWMDELRQLEGYKSYLDCDHKETETFLHCLGCGKWIKV